ncbi:MAG: aldehyde dehydrogenase family protein, partial [bacterium]|nr:aldehyde dehydrogenase family protein [bacterium]
MPISEDELKRIVEEVVKRIPKEEQLRHFTYSGSEVVYKSVDEAVSVAKKAQIEFQDLGIQTRKKVIEAMRQAAVDNAEKLAKMAHNETGFGRWEHKLQKNILVATKTPGVEDLQPVMAYTGDKGLTLVEWAPFGVVASVTPSTNPTATVINNSISIIAAGNSVVFAPHPSAKNCCYETMRILHDAAIRAGAPPGIITSFEPITHETTKQLLAHPDVKMYIVTGGPSIVKVAMTIGKPCKIIAAGPGNPPVIVDETALLPQAASDIISGASFDNCILCTGEKEVFVVEAIWDRFIEAMRK